MHCLAELRPYVDNCSERRMVDPERSDWIRIFSENSFLHKFLFTLDNSLDFNDFTVDLPVDGR